MNLSSISSPLSIVLSGILLLSPLKAQLPSTASVPSPSGELQIRILDSEGLHPLLDSRQQKALSLQVTDEAGNGVADAAVAIRLPDSGPTGTFSDGSHSAVAYTDAFGHTTMSGIQWGNTAGVANVRITASKGSSHAGLLLEQTIGSTVAATVPSGIAPVPQTLPSPMSVVLAAPPDQNRPVVSSTTSNFTARTPSPLGRPVEPVSSERLLPGAGIAPAEPSVSITNDARLPSGQPNFHGSRTKWIVIAAIVAAAGAGTAGALMNKKSSSSSSASSASVGAPSISIGNP